MTHADSLALPDTVKTKKEFHNHVAESLKNLLAGEKVHWITGLANAASLLYGSFENYSAWGKADGRRVNWVGFYLLPQYFGDHTHQKTLELGPFNGRPACVRVTLDSPRVGVCAEGFNTGKTTIVSDVDQHPGHITCDGATRSEIVVPVRFNGKVIGVLDIDCEALNAFDQDDLVGLERFVDVLVSHVGFV